MKTRVHWLIGSGALLVAIVLPVVTQSLEEGGKALAKLHHELAAGMK